MHSLSLSLFLLSLITLIQAATHNIDVGNDLQTIENLVFTPNVTEAAPGDTVIFHFYPGNHDVVSGEFNAPCQPASGGFYSGFINSTSGEADKIFNITINDSAPIWLYCSQASHCKNGMVGAINPPAGALAAYKAAAASINSSVTPNVVSGGIVANNPNFTASSTSSSGTTTATSTTATSTGASGTGSASTASSTSAASLIITTESLEKIMAMVSLVAIGTFMGFV